MKIFFRDIRNLILFKNDIKHAFDAFEGFSGFWRGFWNGYAITILLLSLPFIFWGIVRLFNEM